MVKEIKRLYKNAVIDLEGQENEIVWPREILSYPSFRKANKVATTSSGIKECTLVNHSCKHELSQPPESKQCTTKLVSPISLQTEGSTQLQPMFISAEAQTESAYKDLDVTPTNTGNVYHKAIEQASQPSVDATDSTQSNMSGLSLGNGENKSLQPQSIGFTASAHSRDTDDEIQSVFGSLPHSDGQSSLERLLPDKDDGETCAKIVSMNNSGSQVISELDEPSHQTLSIQKEASTISGDLPHDKGELLQLKSTMAMELLWVQQAINSRKNYLRLKQGIQ